MAAFIVLNEGVVDTNDRLNDITSHVSQAIRPIARPARRVVPICQKPEVAK